MPALMTEKRARRLAPGDKLVVEATDPMAEVDITVLAREQGLDLSLEKLDRLLRFTLQKPRNELA